MLRRWRNLNQDCVDRNWKKGEMEKSWKKQRRWYMVVWLYVAIDVRSQSSSTSLWPLFGELCSVQ